MGYLENVLDVEVYFSVWSQNLLYPVERALEFYSEKFSPARIQNIFVPLLGALDINLAVSLNLFVSIAHLLCDIIKWIYHEDRPYWYVRENILQELVQHRLTCETTSGYPSKHVMSITGFLIILGYFGYRELAKCLNDVESKVCKKIISFGQYFLVIVMGLGRMYFGCHFFHQCLAGGLLALVVLYGIRYNHWRIYSVGKIAFVGTVICLASFVISIYYTMVILDYDPHWPVRMAFKWCTNPEYLKHESTPIYSLCRDFGSMLGTALSAPLIRLTPRRYKRYLSMPFTILFLAINIVAENQTPKNYGRLAFLLYEVGRSTFFTFTQLTVMPWICAEYGPA